MRQVASGATDVATENLIQFMTVVQARLNDSLQYCERELRNPRASASRFGPPGPVQQLMGQVQNVWNRAGVRQNRINALAAEKEQAQDQCDKMATAQTSVQKEINQLRPRNAQLQEEIASLRQDLLAARATPQPVRPPSVSSASSKHAGLADQEQIGMLKQFRGERETLRRENAKLRTANEQWRTESVKEKLHNDKTIDDLYNRWKEAEGKLKRSQGQSTSHLPSHHEMRGHIRLPAAEGRAPHSATAGDPQRPSVLPIPIDLPAYSDATSSAQAPQLAPHRSASATSQGPLDQEEEMESDSQTKSASQEQ